MAITGTEAVALLVARIAFGGTLAFMGVNHFMNTDMMIPYAESKSVPAPKLAVYASGAALLLGGLAILTGVFPALGGLLIAAFFLVATPKMHDFWNAPEEEQQSEMTDFLKNVVMLGASLGFFVLGSQSWDYAVGIGMF